MNLHVIVRAAGERTADCCCRELARQTSESSVERVELTPFWQTLKTGLEKGRDSGAPWVLSVDADMMPAPDLVTRIQKWIEKTDEKVGVMSGMFQDKLLGGVRFGGIRVYRASVIPEMLELMPPKGENVRPESSYLSVSAQKRDHQRMRSCVVCGYYVYSDETRFSVSGGDYGLAQPPGTRLAFIQHPGHRVCLEALADAIRQTGRRPKIFNTDQGSQFTSNDFTDRLAELEISISMAGKGAWRDNVIVERFWRTLKYEEVYLKAYIDAPDARRQIGEFIDRYKTWRPHSAHGELVPDEVYKGEEKYAA